MRADAKLSQLTAALIVSLALSITTAHANPVAEGTDQLAHQGAPELMIPHYLLPFRTSHVPLGWTAHPDHFIAIPALTPAAGSAQGTTVTNPLTPTQVRTAYGLNASSLSTSFSNTTGAGVTIAIIDAYGDTTSSAVSLIQSDLSAFCTNYSLPYNGPSTSSPTLTEAFPEGNPTAGNSSWAIETALDVEWVHAMAPGAHILLISTPDAGDSMFSAVEDAVNEGADIVSMSWGGSEFSAENTYYDPYYAGLNVVYCAATGDTGAEVCYPATCPRVTAVGGTNLIINSADNSWNSETGWDDSGGGISAYETTPSFQSGWQTSGYREVPDVAALGGLPYVHVVQAGSDDYVYGTSLATPIWAGFVGVADGNLTQSLDAATLQQALYSIVTPTTIGSYYHDITSTNYDDSGTAHAAATGYDLNTGIGTPIANLLLPAVVRYAESLASPVLSSISPSVIPTSATARTLTVTGTGFESGAHIEFNGTAQTTTFVSSTQLTCSVSYTTAQSVEVTVLNPSPTNGPSNAVTLTVSSAITNVLLTHSPDAQFSIWWLTGTSPYSYAYPPGSGWKAIAMATGPDNIVHVLLEHPADGAFALWAISVNGSYTYTGYAASSGWLPVDVAVTSDNHVHVLTTNASLGELRLYDFTTPSSYVATPYSEGNGWQAFKIAGGGSNDHLEVLLNHTADNEFSIWDVASPSSFTYQGYGPYNGWKATGMSVNPVTGHTTILDTHTADGEFAIWDMTSATVFTYPAYGPYSGWTAYSLGDTSDGHVQVGQVTSSGEMSIWNMTSPTSIANPVFGPYSGWTPIEVGGY